MAEHTHTKTARARLCLRSCSDIFHAIDALSLPLLPASLQQPAKLALAAACHVDHLHP
jgi:hypothetical protein